MIYWPVALASRSLGGQSRIHTISSKAAFGGMELTGLRPPMTKEANARRA